MEIIETIMLNRDDLSKRSKDKSILDIIIYDFNIDPKIYKKSCLMFFVDKGGETKIIKNRYGDQGIVKK